MKKLTVFLLLISASVMVMAEEVEEVEVFTVEVRDVTPGVHPAVVYSVDIPKGEYFYFNLFPHHRGRKVSSIIVNDGEFPLRTRRVLVMEDMLIQFDTKRALKMFKVDLGPDRVFLKIKGTDEHVMEVAPGPYMIYDEMEERHYKLIVFRDGSLKFKKIRNY